MKKAAAGINELMKVVLYQLMPLVKKGY